MCNTQALFYIAHHECGFPAGPGARMQERKLLRPELKFRSGRLSLYLDTGAARSRDRALKRRRHSLNRIEKTGQEGVRKSRNECGTFTFLKATALPTHFEEVRNGEIKSCVV